MSETAVTKEKVKLFKLAQNNWVWTCKCSRYPDFVEIFAVGEKTEKVVINPQGGFIIKRDCLQKVINQPNALDGLIHLFVSPPPKESSMRDGRQDFSEMFNAWKTNTLTLVREFTTDHFSWPALIDNPSMLVSEGDYDSPTFTMDNTHKTRWIPTAYYPNYPNGIGAIAISGTGGKVRDFLKGVNAWVPIGVYATILCGKSHPLKLAWLNAGETVVKGPLDASSFTIDKMVCCRVDNSDYFDFKVIDVSDIDIRGLPQRPYIGQGTRILENNQLPALRNWWASMGVINFMRLIENKLV